MNDQHHWKGMLDTDGKLSLEGLPFAKGQLVEVTVKLVPADEAREVIDSRIEAWNQVFNHPRAALEGVLLMEKSTDRLHIYEEKSL